MPGIDKAKGRLVALVALVGVAGISLRGYLPGDERSARGQSSGSPASLFAVVAVLSVSMVIVAIAIIAWLRDPRNAAPSPHDLPRGFGAAPSRPKWRFLLIVLGAFLMWLLAVMLLLRLFAPRSIDQPATSSTAAAHSDGSPPPSPPQPHADGDIFWYLVASTAVLLVLLAAAAVVAIRRRRPAPTPRPVAGEKAAPPSAPPGPESLALAAERGLAEIEDLSREPREAIIACYAAMERGLADAPGVVPLDSDTPTEVLARAVEHGAIHPGSATELVHLFAEARFSVHVMNEGHRDAAVRALHLVLGELRSLA
jgi:hypothetical protein